ncbi:hypothetical protein BH10PSE12_BH10PSE12_16570 [soil metagenome]
MAEVFIVPSRFTHIGPIATRMREADRIECEAMGQTPKHALRDGFMLSDAAWTALVDGRPEAMFGWLTTSAIGREVRPWFLGTASVYAHGRALLTLGPKYVSNLSRSSSSARNWVSATNDRAIRLLKKWGFSIGDEIQVRRGVPFLEFWMKT